MGALHLGILRLGVLRLGILRLGALHLRGAKLCIGLLVAAGLVGCVGDPDLVVRERAIAEPGIALDHEVDRALWGRATPGCEGIPREGSYLVACEGEPLLGAIVDSENGNICCVDSLSLIIEELDTAGMDASGIAPTSADPSPQPSHPGIHPRAGAHRVAASRADDGGWAAVNATIEADPTPTPVTRADPTPTPVTQGDPTPTPTMED
jgi:hypothetical protein